MTEGPGAGTAAALPGDGGVARAALYREPVRALVLPSRPGCRARIPGPSVGADASRCRRQAARHRRGFGSGAGCRRTAPADRAPRGSYHGLLELRTCPRRSAAGPDRNECHRGGGARGRRRSRLGRVSAGRSWKPRCRLRGFATLAYPTSAPAATAGGWLSMEGYGIGSLAHGSLAGQVLRLQVVLPDGQVIDRGGWWGECSG